MLEADFQRFYALDLRYEVERVGVRRLCALVEGLPPEAAIWRVDGKQWTTLHELLAINAEVMDQWGLANVRVQGGGKALKGHKPLRIPRPGDKAQGKSERRKPVDDPARADAFFAKTPKF